MTKCPRGGDGLELALMMPIRQRPPLPFTPASRVSSCSLFSPRCEFGLREKFNFVRCIPAVCCPLICASRDKYMFHQANIIPSNEAELGGKSLLEYWYERVMQDYAKWITFPVKVSRARTVTRSLYAFGSVEFSF